MTRTHRIAELVATLHGLVERAEAGWRRQRLPPLTRDRPRPDPEAMQGAQTLEAAIRTLDLIGGQLRSLPGPDAARMAARLGADAPARLVEAEDALLAHGAFLAELLAPTAPSMLPPDEIGGAVAHLRELAQRRAGLLA